MPSETPPLPSPSPIRITYRDCAAHLMEANQQATPQKIPWGRWLVIVLMVVMLLFIKTGLEYRSEGIPWLSLGLGGGFILFVICLLLLVTAAAGKAGAFSRGLYRIAYRAQNRCDERRMVGEFGDAALALSAEGGMPAQYVWSNVARAVARSKGLLIYTTPKVFHWFPKTAFASEADYAATISLVRSKVAVFRELP